MCVLPICLLYIKSMQHVRHGNRLFTKFIRYSTHRFVYDFLVSKNALFSYFVVSNPYKPFCIIVLQKPYKLKNTDSMYTASLIPRPSQFEGEGKGRPGTHFMRMRPSFFCKMSVKVGSHVGPRRSWLYFQQLYVAKGMLIPS